MNSEKLLPWYLGHLRFLYLMYQNCHWQCAGLSFYQDHLLFQRLYEGIVEDVDATAEKIIGVFDTKLVSFEKQCEIINHISENVKLDASIPINCFKNAVRAEESFLKLSKKLRTVLDEEDKLSLGIDDLLAAQANSSEERLYLLKSSLPQS
jgi:DNA-binding ferritin-like protein